MRATEDAGALTGRRFASLLARLHPDSVQAGAEYELLRRALIRFFDWRGATAADVCADECLDRLARRLDEQTPVQDVRHFALGIARLVLLERQRQPVLMSLDQAPQVADLASRPQDTDPLVGCFEQCLAAMPAENRTLVLGYYEAERTDRIGHRRQLAVSMGLTDNALRSRVQRVRDRLETCVQDCVSRPGQERA